jgi:AraC family transcriptional activator of tynA and feaB
MTNVVEHWDIEALPVEDRFDVWREVLAETHVPWDLGSSRAASPDYRAWVERRRVAELRLVDCGCDPCAGTRGSREIRTTGDEWAVVLFNLQGREIFEQSENCSELGPGGSVLWQSTKPARFTVLEPLHKRCLFVPRALLEEFCPNFHRLTGLSLHQETAETQLFLSFIAEVIRAFPSLDSAGQATAARVTVELLAAAVQPQLGIEPVTLREALFPTICRYIDRSLGDPSLHPPTIAAAHSISLRTLQLIFAERGETVSERIRRLRLDHCYTELSQAALPVTSVAFRWGFVDVSHFSRVFKERYGVSPREVRLAAPESIRRPR